jgi:hypothetical protein
MLHHVSFRQPAGLAVHSIATLLIPLQLDLFNFHSVIQSLGYSVATRLIQLQLAIQLQPSFNCNPPEQFEVR